MKEKSLHGLKRMVCLARNNKLHCSSKIHEGEENWNDMFAIVVDELDLSSYSPKNLMVALIDLINKKTRILRQKPGSIYHYKSLSMSCVPTINDRIRCEEGILNKDIIISKSIEINVPKDVNSNCVTTYGKHNKSYCEFDIGFKEKTKKIPIEFK